MEQKHKSPVVEAGVMKNKVLSEDDVGYASVSMTSSDLLDSGLMSDSLNQQHDMHKGSSTHSSVFDSGYGVDSICLSQEKLVDIQLVSTSLSWKGYYTQDANGDTMLQRFILENRTEEEIWAILRSTPHPDLLDITNFDGQTALHLSAALCHPVLRMLVVGGATVDARDLRGNTPLHLAAKAGSVSGVRDLLFPVTQQEAKALRLSYTIHVDNNSALSSWDLNATNYNGETPLHLAVRYGHVDVVRELLRYPAISPTVRELKEGMTALHMACVQDRPDLAVAILESAASGGDNLDSIINAFDYGKRTSLWRVWDLQRHRRNDRHLLELIVLLRRFGGQPEVDPGSDDDDDECCCHQEEVSDEL